MRCELNEVAWGQKRLPIISRKELVKSKMAILAAAMLAIFAIACGSGGSGSINPPPPSASELFIVDNFSGDVSAFSAASGKLEAIPGSSAMFPLVLTNFAVMPDGTLLAVITVSPQLVSHFQIANIAAGGGISPQPLTTVLTNPGGMAISSQGVIAVTDSFNNTVQLMAVQSNALFQGPSAATGPLPQDAVFSADGSRLYVGNNADGTISFFALSNLGATIQLVQTARLPVAAG
jgi:DNA-binding beta-propeller fold protein YncE